MDINVQNIKDLKIPRGWITIAIVAILLLVVVLGSFYTIGTDEVGLVLRFGKYVRQSEPGLHFKIPLGVEKVYSVKVRRVFKEEFGFRTLEAGVRTLYSEREFDEESIILTGDLNVADVEWVIQYRVVDPYPYLFKIRNPRKALRDISQAVMSQVVGDWTVSGVLTIGRAEITAEVKNRLQEIMDAYETGIKVGTVTLQDVNPPGPVRASFNEVNEARQEKEQMVNQAWEEYNQEIPKAQGEAMRTIAQAEGYALGRVNRAKGDAEKFTAVWEEYRKAKDVTRRRLYIETLSEVLPKVEELYIVDKDQRSILPLLDLTWRGREEKGGEGK